MGTPCGVSLMGKDDVMRNVLRIGVAVAGLAVTLPAWADGASVPDRQDMQQAELRGENPALPQLVASAPAPGSPAQTSEGSGSGEPASSPGSETQPEQSDGAPQQ